MELILEVVVYILFEWLIIYPGAFVRWMYYGKNKSLKEVAKEENLYNFSLSILIIILIVMILILFQ